MASAPEQMTACLRGGEAIFVYGTDVAGRCDAGSAAVAARYHEASPGRGSGMNGHAYAIPYRNSAGNLLPLLTIGHYVKSFLEFAAAQPAMRFHVASFGCDRQEYDSATMAGLFAGMPGNCRLPGEWERHLQRNMPARLLVFDPGANLARAEWQERLRAYLALNEPLWNVPSVEIVSVGNPRSVVANNMAAKALGLKHRVIGANDKVFGQNAAIVAEYRAVWYATHFLAIANLDQTSDPQQIRLMSAAGRAGLLVDMLESEG